MKKHKMKLTEREIASLKDGTVEVSLATKATKIKLTNKEMKKRRKKMEKLLLGYIREDDVLVTSKSMFLSGICSRIYQSIAIEDQSKIKAVA